jgi:hypothetical protein
MTAVMYCTIGGRNIYVCNSHRKKTEVVMSFRDGIVGCCRVDLPLETPEKIPTNKVLT